MGRRAERTRYFVGSKGSAYQALAVAVDIGSPADKAAVDAFRRRLGWDVIQETDLLGYTAYLRKHRI